MIVSPALCVEPDQVFSQLSSKRNIALQHESQLQSLRLQLRAVQRRSGLPMR